MSARSFAGLDAEEKSNPDKAPVLYNRAAVNAFGSRDRSDS